MQYKGDERWKLIQLNANNAANISNTVLIVLIVVLPLLIDSQTTFYTTESGYICADLYWNTEFD